MIDVLTVRNGIDSKLNDSDSMMKTSVHVYGDQFEKLTVFCLHQSPMT